TTAQNVLPVIDEPWIRSSPCPSQTTPVRNSNAPRIRLAIGTARIAGGYVQAGAEASPQADFRGGLRGAPPLLRRRRTTGRAASVEWVAEEAQTSSSAGGPGDRALPARLPWRSERVHSTRELSQPPP